MEQALTMPHAPAVEDRVSELDDIDALVARYQAKVLRWAALSLGDADEAATIAQDCFLRAYATREQYRGQCAASTWLLQIAGNLIRDRVRTRRFQFWRRAQLHALDAGELAAHLPSGASSNESQLLARERVSQVWAALATLSARQRSVFVLRFVEEMELGEIAAATGMTLATVKTHLYRALHEVRERVGQGREGSAA